MEHREIDKNYYKDLYNLCSQANLLQSAEYGEAKSKAEGFQVLRVAVVKDGAPISIYQALLKIFPLLGTVVRINRAPLFLPDSVLDGNTIADLYHSLYNEWVIRRKSLLTIAPNLNDDLENIAIIKHIGFHPGSEKKWESGYLDLNCSPDVLRKGLLQKWRNMLNKAERLGMEFKIANGHEELDLQLGEYGCFMRERNFRGVSCELLMALHMCNPGMLHIFTAIREGHQIGTVITAAHGDTCTYLVGFTSEDGRKCNANYFLLWNALLWCRGEGIRWFDVGGIDNVNTPGISHFKEGLGIMP